MLFQLPPTPKQLQKMPQAIEGNDIDRQRQLTNYLEDIEKNGGKSFVERVRLYGCTEKGDAISFDPWFSEALQCLGDLRIPIVLTSGCAQIGKTLANTFLAIDSLCESGQNIGWFYSDLSALRRNEPEQFEPIALEWIKKRAKKTGIPISRPGDRRNCERFTYHGATQIFSYASTSRPTALRKGLAAVGSAGASFSCSLLFLEERSQWLPSAADGVTRRLDAGRIPSRPVRELGTFGSGSGIETEFLKANYHFYPHVECAHCGAKQPLDPKGCLLKSVKRENAFGEMVDHYFGVSGKPEEWLHSNVDDPIGSAYIGCRVCEKPLSPETRINAYFECLKTGIRLSHFLDEIVPTLKTRYSVGIHFSPLTRKDHNLAERLIAEGLDAVSATDWQQQALGWWYQNEENTISLDSVNASIGLPAPIGQEPYARLMGVDQGRSEDWGIIIDFYLDGGSTIQEQFTRAIRQVRWGGGIVRSFIPDKIKTLNVERCLIDSEPNIETAFELSRKSLIELADQQANLLDDFKAGIAMDGGKEFKVWKLRSGKYMKQVMQGFYQRASDGMPLYRLPLEWQKWQALNTEKSPIRHLTSVSFDSDSGLWERPKDKADGVFYAAMFCEAMFMLKLSGVLKKKTYFNTFNIPTWSEEDENIDSAISLDSEKLTE
ncbi:MAG: hypothetical protein KME15_27705 [Drouetiella hepatica Uher 2000/2452]|jgi:hypothetical protein|uniref:Uncharacterized protein n=1 Tax=Drouetiella hepatica Uher 2000/2452 TaxID=904376 RepID=A0A951UQJ2_9CYAN|nr:hypothetical protein [Drouetiella hepatica Uher 2000/2452]